MLAVSSDGMNPFGKQNTNHSTWPVFLWKYNIPPWKCMKTNYMHESFLSLGDYERKNAREYIENFMVMNKEKEMVLVPYHPM